jgi:2-amino-4-hydroxy-6-hydroxymethyldihydropteridine diphosphokinase
MILIALGSNLPGPWGSPRQTLLRALKEMPFHNIRVRNVSRLLETAPFGVTNQPGFVNAVALVETRLAPEALMRALHMIERKAGRVRRKRWGPRTLDLDLIDYNGLVRAPARTTIKPLALPHPGVSERTFVLEPLVEIAPCWRHPVNRELAALTLRKLCRLSRG